MLSPQVDKESSFGTKNLTSSLNMIAEKDRATLDRLYEGLIELPEVEQEIAKIEKLREQLDVDVGCHCFSLNQKESQHTLSDIARKLLLASLEAQFLQRVGQGLREMA